MKDVMNVAEIASCLGRSRRTVERMIADGRNQACTQDRAQLVRQRGEGMARSFRARKIRRTFIKK